MNTDDVRAAMKRHEEDSGDGHAAGVLYRFAAAVLNPPMPVRVAMEYRAENPMRDNPGPNAVIADWIVSLITTTPETPK